MSNVFFISEILEARKKLSELLAESADARVMALHADNGEMVGVARYELVRKTEVLFRIVLLNPAYIHHAEEWMVHMLPEVIRYAFSTLGRRVLYTNLHPLLEKAVSGYKELGFSELPSEEAFKSGGVTFKSLVLEKV